jgi:hypothetical protein
MSSCLKEPSLNSTLANQKCAAAPCNLRGAQEKSLANRDDLFKHCTSGPFCSLEQRCGTVVRIMSSRTQLVPSVIILGPGPSAINHSYTGTRLAVICLPPLSSFPEQTATRVTFDSSDSLLPEPEPPPHAARRQPTGVTVFRAHFRVSTSGAPKLRSARCPRP